MGMHCGDQGAHRLDEDGTRERASASVFKATDHRRDDHITYPESDEKQICSVSSVRFMGETSLA